MKVFIYNPLHQIYFLVLLPIWGLSISLALISLESENTGRLETLQNEFNFFTETIAREMNYNQNVTSPPHLMLLLDSIINTQPALQYIVIRNSQKQVIVSTGPQKENALETPNTTTLFSINSHKYSLNWKGEILGEVEFVLKNHLWNDYRNKLILFHGGVALFFSIITIIFIKLILSPTIQDVHSLIHKLRNFAHNQGNFTERIKMTSHNEVGELGHWLELFFKQVHTLIITVKQNISNINVNSNTLFETIQQNTNAIEGSADNLFSIQESLESQFEQIEKISNISGQQKEIINGIIQNVQNISQKTTILNKRIDQQMQGVHRIAPHSMRQDGKLPDTSIQETELVGMDSVINAVNVFKNFSSNIKNIASKSKILSLNALIEASTAGKAGKGFAVVADALEKLSGLSTSEAIHAAKAMDNLENSSEDMVKLIVEIAEVSEEVKSHYDEIKQLLNDMQNDLETLDVFSTDSKNQTLQVEHFSQQITQDVGVVTQASKSMKQEAQTTMATTTRYAPGINSLEGLLKNYKTED